MVEFLPGSCATILEQLCTNMGPVKVEVVINTRSGAGHSTDVQDRVAEAFKTHGVEARISLAHTGHAVIKIARQAVQSNAEAIVAGGGDAQLVQWQQSLLTPIKRWESCRLGR